MTNDITLILGGARSGKSAFAERLALDARLPVTYLATADVLDDEMACRVEIHKNRRPTGWNTWEGLPSDLPGEVAAMSGVLLLDCLTLWLTRFFLETDVESMGEKEWNVRELEIRSLTEQLCRAPGLDAKLIIVSNELGLGLVPTSLAARRFRDLQGRMNQLVASLSCRVALVVAGCPLWIKNSQTESKTNE